jgi:hypothetical protein
VGTSDSLLATQEAEIRGITVRSQLRQLVARPYLKKTLHKKRAGVSPEFKPQYHKKKKRKKEKKRVF